MGFGALVVLHADWGRYGRAAGPMRNGQMLDALVSGPVAPADDAHDRLVIAFHDSLSESRGTADMVGKARRARKLRPELGIRIQNVSHPKP